MRAFPVAELPMLRDYVFVAETIPPRDHDSHDAESDAAGGARSDDEAARLV